MKGSVLQFPSVFLPVEEPNRFLFKYKTSLRKRWTLTRMDGLFEEVDLAYYLAALERTEEALGVLDFIADHRAFDENYNLWTPVGYALSLQARLYRLVGRRNASEVALERIRIHPFLIVRREDIESFLRSLPVLIEEADRSSSTKWKCHNLARLLYKCCFYRETSGIAGFPHSDWYLAEAVEPYLTVAFERLKHHLQAV